MTATPPRQPRARRGLSTIKVLLAIPSVAMLAWLGTEVALVVRAANQAKTAADAIALAAAARFADGDEIARIDALTAAAASVGPKGPIVISVPEGPAGGGNLYFGAWDETSRTFVAQEDGGPAARATVRLGGDSPNGAPGFILPGIFELAEISMERSSVAIYSPPRHATALHVVGSGRETLALEDNATCSSRNGVAVQSKDGEAVSVGEQCALTAPILRIAGGIAPTGATGIEGAVETGSMVAVDPFCMTALPPLDASSATAIAHTEGSTTLVAPGVHDGLDIASGTVVLLPGLHQFAGPVNLAGTARVELDRATVHFASGDGLSLTDSAKMTGTPATGIGAWSGFALVERGLSTIWRVSGDASIGIDGILYAPDTRLNASGTASVAIDSAILGQYRGSETSALMLDEKIDELDLPFVAGRARLVR